MKQVLLGLLAAVVLTATIYGIGYLYWRHDQND